VEGAVREWQASREARVAEVRQFSRLGGRRDSHSWGRHGASEKGRKDELECVGPNICAVGLKIG